MATAMPPVAVVTSAEIVTTPPSIGEADRVTVVKGDNWISAALSPGVYNRRAGIRQNAISSPAVDRILSGRDILKVPSAPPVQIASQIIWIASLI